MKIYYQILGVRHGAGIAEIKKAYREKVKKFHPDVNKSEEATKQFLLVQQAYNNLLNPQKEKNRASQSAYRNGPGYSRGANTQQKGTFYSFYAGHERQYAQSQAWQRKTEKRMNLAQRIFIWFIHLVFMIIGLMVLFIPLSMLVIHGFDPDEPVLAQAIAVFFISIVGISLLTGVFLSAKVFIFKSNAKS